MGSTYSEMCALMQHFWRADEHRVAAEWATPGRTVGSSRNGYSAPSICNQRVAIILFCIVATMVGIAQRCAATFGLSFNA